MLPDITAPTPETVITVNEGMAATFECNATGIPAPNITWRRERDSSEFNDRLDSRITLGIQTTPIPVPTLIGTIFSVSRQLTLSNTTDSDSGIYFCQASNGVEETPFMMAEIPFVLFVAGVNHNMKISTVALSCISLPLFSYSCTSGHSNSRREYRPPGRLCGVHLYCYC